MTVAPASWAASTWVPAGGVGRADDDDLRALGDHGLDLRLLVGDRVGGAGVLHVGLEAGVLEAVGEQVTGEDPVLRGLRRAGRRRSASPAAKPLARARPVRAEWSSRSDRVAAAAPPGASAMLRMRVDLRERRCMVEAAVVSEESRTAWWTALRSGAGCGWWRALRSVRSPSARRAGGLASGRRRPGCRSAVVRRGRCRDAVLSRRKRSGQEPDDRERPWLLL